MLEWLILAWFLTLDDKKEELDEDAYSYNTSDNKGYDDEDYDDDFDYSDDY